MSTTTTTTTGRRTERAAALPAPRLPPDAIDAMLAALAALPPEDRLPDEQCVHDATRGDTDATGLPCVRAALAHLDHCPVTL